VDNVIIADVDSLHVKMITLSTYLAATKLELSSPMTTKITDKLRTQR
jgi:hypothetical protein